MRSVLPLLLLLGCSLPEAPISTIPAMGSQIVPGEQSSDGTYRSETSPEFRRAHGGRIPPGGRPQEAGNWIPATAAPDAAPVPPLKQALAAHDGELWLSIDKSERSLAVFKGEHEVRRYRVGLAPRVPNDPDKIREGDRATPEGDFRIVTRNDRSSFHLFMGISYPNAEDAERGLQDGLITPDEARRIREADATGRVPPWNTTLGGAIGIHGGGGSGDWTLGCIAVENQEIEELWAAVPMGTRVRIVR